MRMHRKVVIKCTILKKLSITLAQLRVVEIEEEGFIDITFSKRTRTGCGEKSQEKRENCRLNTAEKKERRDI